MPRRKRPTRSPLPEPPIPTLEQLAEAWHTVSGEIADKLNAAIVGNKAEDARKLSVCAGIAIDRIKDIEDAPGQSSAAIPRALLEPFRVLVQRQGEKDSKATQRAKRLAKWLPRALQEIERLQEALREDRVGDTQRWAIAAGIATSKVVRYATQMETADEDRRALFVIFDLAYRWRHETPEEVVRLLQRRGLSRDQANEAGFVLAMRAGTDDQGESAPDGTLACLGRALQAAYARIRTLQGVPHDPAAPIDGLFSRMRSTSSRGQFGPSSE